MYSSVKASTKLSSLNLIMINPRTKILITGQRIARQPYDFSKTIRVLWWRHHRPILTLPNRTFKEVVVDAVVEKVKATVEDQVQRIGKRHGRTDFAQNVARKVTHTGDVQARSPTMMISPPGLHLASQVPSQAAARAAELPKLNSSRNNSRSRRRLLLQWKPK